MLLRPVLLPAVVLLAAALVVPVASAAHGPTVALSYQSVRPATLTVRAGDTVHFRNANTGAGACTVVGDDGAFESPTLGRAEGWHHTFEEPGVYGFALRESPSARGRIVVAAPED